MTTVYAIAMIAVAAVCTFATRVAPFLLFNGSKPIPPIIRYLGSTLPPAVIALLVVYCLKNVGWVTGTHGIPELLCIAITALLHIWKHNNLLSIGVGTVLYMVLVQNPYAGADRCVRPFLNSDAQGFTIIFDNFAKSC